MMEGRRRRLAEAVNPLTDEEAWAFLKGLRLLVESFDGAKEEAAHGRVVSWCLGNKSVVFLATLLLIGSGIFATTRLNQELLPDVDFPVILVSTPVPGAGPEVVDEQVSQPVEGAIGGVRA
jgi:hypothetical protein